MLYDGKLWVAPISSLSCPKNCHYVNKYYKGTPLYDAPISSLSCPKNCHYVNKYYEEKNPAIFLKTNLN